MAIVKKTPTKRTLNALETKNTIFKSAVHLFSKYGYDRVTVDDIVRRAGVSKGAFYHHFETKESILAEQFNKIDDAYDAVFVEGFEAKGARENLLLLVDTMTHYCTDVCGIEVIRVVYAAQIVGAKSVPILNNKKRRIYHYLRQIVNQGLKNGEFVVQMPEEELVELLMRACRSLVYDWCLYGGEMDLNAEGQKYFGTLLAWLEKK